MLLYTKLFNGSRNYLLCKIIYTYGMDKNKNLYTRSFSHLLNVHWYHHFQSEGSGMTSQFQVLFVNIFRVMRLGSNLISLIFHLGSKIRKKNMCKNTHLKAFEMHFSTLYHKNKVHVLILDESQFLSYFCKSHHIYESLISVSNDLNRAQKDFMSH